MCCVLLLTALHIHASPARAASEPVVRFPATATAGAVRLGRVGVLSFPMATLPRCDILDSFGDPRSGGRSHEGVDMLATLGQQVFAAADGVLTTQYVNGATNAALSGNAWRLSAADGSVFFYAHLSGFAPGLTVGSSVAAGQLIGFVGDTGNPGAGNFHLHFEYQPDGVPVNSLPLLTIPTACKVY
jgi:murein DD-endopeptidase MepM/ murein hydrolase activator NlpD